MIYKTGLGSKTQPFHVLLKHGSIKSDFPNDTEIDYKSLQKWFENCKQEGIVWHCSNGKMFKVTSIML